MSEKEVEKALNHTTISKKYYQRIEKDKFIQKIIDIELTYEANILLNNSLKETFRTFKAYYEEGISFSEYVNKLWNHNNYEYVKNRMTELAKQLNEVLNLNDLNLAQKFIIRKLYNIYVGFMFEEYIIELLNSNRFKTITSKEIDFDGIDIIVEYENRRIGLQLKSYTYLNLNNEIKEKHQIKLKLAQKKYHLKEVYFLFHNSISELMKVNLKLFGMIELGYKILISNPKEDYEVDIALEEELIEEIKEAFEEKENKDIVLKAMGI